MDNFKFTIAMKQIEMLKTLKDREGLIRTYTEELEEFNYGVMDSNINIAEFFLILTTKLVSEWDSCRNLPRFISERITSTQKTITSYYIRNNIPYYRYLSTFKYCNCVNLYDPTLSEIKVLAEIFGSNKIPFKFEYNIVSSLYTKFLYTSLEAPLHIVNSNVNLGLAVELEAIKIELASTGIKYTVIEDILSLIYPNTIKDKVENFTKKARYKIDLLKKANDVMLSKLQA